MRNLLRRSYNDLWDIVESSAISCREVARIYRKSTKFHVISQEFLKERYFPFLFLNSQLETTSIEHILFDFEIYLSMGKSLYIGVYRNSKYHSCIRLWSNDFHVSFGAQIKRMAPLSITH